MPRKYANEPFLTAAEARQCLEYDSGTGVIRWREPASSRLAAGEVAGSVRADGYRQIRVNYRRFYAHRLAWLLHYGSWPEGDIDHENHNPSDNRISNLRAVSNAENHKNLPLYRCNRSGVSGIYRSPAGSWVVRVYRDRMKHHVGSFPCFAQAVRALRKRRAELGFHENHGLPRAA